MEGGRLRERRCKRGRKKAGHKRQGYHTDWREPKLFTIDLLDPQGEVVEAFAPLQDATLGDHEQLFALTLVLPACIGLVASGTVRLLWRWRAVDLARRAGAVSAPGAGPRERP